MSKHGIKRRSSSNHSEDDIDHRPKKRKSSPEPKNNQSKSSTLTSTLTKSKSQNPKSISLFSKITDSLERFIMGSVLQTASSSNPIKQTAPTHSSSNHQDQEPSSSSSSYSPPLNSSDGSLKPYPGGSLALLNSYDHDHSSSSRSIDDGDKEDAGSSSDNPIDLVDGDEESDNDGRENHVIKPNSFHSSQIQAKAGPSKPRLSPSLSNDGPLLFSETFSQKQLPTPPDSQSQTEEAEPEPSKRTLDIYPKLPTPQQQFGKFNKSQLTLGTILRDGLRKQPSRPDVSLSGKKHERKAWELSLSAKRSPSPSSSTSSRHSTKSERHRKRKSNLRSSKQSERIQQSHIRAQLTKMKNVVEAEGKYNLGKSAQRVQRMLMGQPLKNAAEVTHRMYVQAGLNDKFVYRNLLLANQGGPVTLEEKTTPKPVIYDVSRKRAQGKAAKDKALEGPFHDLREVASSLREIIDEEIRKEKEIKERLTQPKVPAALTPEQENKVIENLNNTSFKAKISVAECGAQSLRRLKNTMWLDDEVMNFYGGMMIERAKTDGGKKIHFFNSFFYQRISDSGHSAVKRWTRKLDIFDFDVVLFPINIGNMHWTACAINLEKKRIEYYDSMGDSGNQRANVFKRVRAYLTDEHMERKKKSFNFDGWTNEFNDHTPQQDNGSDCGVFSCQTLEMITRGRDLKDQSFEFDSSNMPFFRKLMVLEIGNGKLEKRSWGNPKI
ncbi:uncharacterized protein IL334_000432 [Kwoniella shivajii]|uniref:Ubiquitin-like protease family profile domain-containing protein n=1 Tax=Kwoniella shivajii TaxID=564305 RepID=A0ABZ1CQ77_9TREE|nr:hypothetical protein IL334_000432 [Kwoniella shivajii]